MPGAQKTAQQSPLDLARGYINGEEGTANEYYLGFISAEIARHIDSGKLEGMAALGYMIGKTFDADPARNSRSRLLLDAVRQKSKRPDFDQRVQRIGTYHFNGLNGERLRQQQPTAARR